MGEVPAFDDALLQEHLALAAGQMPGPDYYRVLRWIHEILRPANYVEIGIRKGDSLRLASAETTCVGIDPEPDIQAELPPNMRVFRMTSDAFFADYGVPHVSDLLHAPTFNLAFIDGLHLFEQVSRESFGHKAYSAQLDSCANNIAEIGA